MERVRRRCVEQWVEAATGRKGQLNHRPRKLNGDGEARMIAMAVSQPPEGWAGWTLRMLAEAGPLPCFAAACGSHRTLFSTSPSEVLLP